MLSTLLRAALVSLALAASAVAGHGTVIVSTRADTNIVYLCAETGSELARFDAGIGAHEIAVSPDGRTAVGSAYGSGKGHATPDYRLFVIDIEAKEVTRIIDLGVDHPRPNDLAFLPDNRHILVTSEVNRSVIKVDTHTGDTVATMRHAEPGAHMLAVTADGTRCFVPCVPHGKVVVIDVNKGEVTGTLQAAVGAEGVAVSPDGKRLWVANNRSQSISVFDTDKMELIATIPSDGYPFRARFSPDGNRVVISHPMTHEIRVYDAHQNELLTRIRVGPEESETAPTSICLNKDGTRCYAVCAATGEVAVIDLTELKVIALTPAGPIADGLAWTSKSMS